MTQHKIIIAEDEGLLRTTLTAFLQEHGFSVTGFEDGRSAWEELNQQTYDILITDLNMPELGGMELAHEAKRINPEMIIIVITGYGAIATAVEAMRAGAFDYLTKPLINQEVLLTVNKALKQRRQQRQLDLYRYQAEQDTSSEQCIGVSEVMEEIRKQVAKVADSDATILIQGESGTGKEVIARELHRQSRRTAFPLIALNCAALPGNLLENELFGHEPGAFTGADQEKKGLLEMAHGGTLFLDEIGDMVLELQARLLRVLEEKQFRRLGGNRNITVDVRLIAATNQNLQQLIAEKKFREDLYYRLNVIGIMLPPLRERPKDIVPLLEYFLDEFRHNYHRPEVNITPTALVALQSYGWPGNIRELRNIVERAFLLCTNDMITEEQLLLTPATKTGCASVINSDIDFSLPLKELRQQVIDDLETRYLTVLLNNCGNNLSETARQAGLSRNALRDKLKKLHIS